MWGKVWAPKGKMVSFIAIFFKIAGLAVGAANAHRLLPLGGNGSRRWGDFKYSTSPGLRRQKPDRNPPCASDIAHDWCP